MKKIDLLHIKYEKLFNYPFMLQAANGYKLFTNQKYKLYELYIDTKLIFNYIIILGALNKDHYFVVSFDKNTLDIKLPFCPSIKTIEKMKLKLYNKKDKNSIIDLLFNKMERFYSH